MRLNVIRAHMTLSPNVLAHKCPVSTTSLAEKLRKASLSWYPWYTATRLIIFSVKVRNSLAWLKTKTNAIFPYNFDPQ